MRPELLGTREAYATKTETLQSLNRREYLTSNHAEGGRVGKLLSWLIQLENNGHPITQIKGQDGTVRYT